MRQMQPPVSQLKRLAGWACQLQAVWLLLLEPVRRPVALSAQPPQRHLAHATGFAVSR